VCSAAGAELAGRVASATGAAAMMRPGADVQVYLCREPVDFRKGVKCLTVLVEQALGLDPFAAALYVFINKHRTKTRLVYWERNGFCLWTKHLEKAHFKWPRHLDGDTVTLTGQELNWLLDGYDLWANSPHKPLIYSSVS
jgi:transposase